MEDSNTDPQEHQASEEVGEEGRRTALKRLRDIAVVAPITYVLLDATDAEAAGGSPGGGFS